MDYQYVQADNPWYNCYLVAYNSKYIHISGVEQGKCMDAYDPEKVTFTNSVNQLTRVCTVCHDEQTPGNRLVGRASKIG